MSDNKDRPDAPLDVEYRKLMELTGEEGCLCGIPGCPGHEMIDGKIVIEGHPSGKTIIIEDRSKKDSD